MKEHERELEIEHVYRRRGGDFYRLALARTGDRELAREAVQEGFANALDHRRSFVGDGPLEAWIARCVINAARDARRAARHRHETIEPPGAPNGEPTLAEAEVIRRALRRLPSRQRDALFLRFYLDFDYRAIAEALAIEVGTVSATLHAARASLAAVLQEVPR